MIKNDPISIMIYIIIGIIIYFVLAGIFKFFEYYLMLPVFVGLEPVINHKLLFIPKIIYSIIYSTQVIVFLSIILAIIVIVLIFLYIIRFILLFMIPSFPIPIGIILYEVIPPFKQLDEAGIFKLIEDIISTVFKFFPFLQLTVIKIIKILIIFSKKNFIDLIKELNPDLDLDNSEFSKIFIEEFMNDDNKDKKADDIIKESKKKITEYIENFEESSKQNSKFYDDTKKAMENQLAAESYKSYDSVLPNMNLINIMTTALNNNTTTFTKKTSTIADRIKLELSKTAD